MRPVNSEESKEQHFQEFVKSLWQCLQFLSVGRRDPHRQEVQWTNDSSIQMNVWWKHAQIIDEFMETVIQIIDEQSELAKYVDCGLYISDLRILLARDLLRIIAHPFVELNRDFACGLHGRQAAHEQGQNRFRLRRTWVNLGEGQNNDRARTSSSTPAHNAKKELFLTLRKTRKFTEPEEVFTNEKELRKCLSDCINGEKVRSDFLVKNSEKMTNPGFLDIFSGVLQTLDGCERLNAQYRKTHGLMFHLSEQLKDKLPQKKKIAAQCRFIDLMISSLKHEINLEVQSHYFQLYDQDQEALEGMISELENTINAWQSQDLLSWESETDADNWNKGLTERLNDLEELKNQCTDVFRKTRLWHRYKSKAMVLYETLSSEERELLITQQASYLSQIQDIVEYRRVVAEKCDRADEQERKNRAVEGLEKKVQSLEKSWEQSNTEKATLREQSGEISTLLQSAVEANQRLDDEKKILSDCIAKRTEACLRQEQKIKDLERAKDVLQEKLDTSRRECQSLRDGVNIRDHSEFKAKVKEVERLKYEIDHLKDTRNDRNAYMIEIIKRSLALAERKMWREWQLVFWCVVLMWSLLCLSMDGVGMLMARGVIPMMAVMCTLSMYALCRQCVRYVHALSKGQRPILKDMKRVLLVVPIIYAMAYFLVRQLRSFPWQVWLNSGVPVSLIFMTSIAFVVLESACRMLLTGKKNESIKSLLLTLGASLRFRVERFLTYVGCSPLGSWTVEKHANVIRPHDIAMGLESDKKSLGFIPSNHEQSVLLDYCISMLRLS